MTDKRWVVQDVEDPSAPFYGPFLTEAEAEEFRTQMSEAIAIKSPVTAEQIRESIHVGPLFSADEFRSKQSE